jgi:cupin 2 domain-containing protein
LTHHNELFIVHRQDIKFLSVLPKTFSRKKMKNIFADVPEIFPDTLPDNSKDELFDTLVQAPSFRLERIVSRGHCSPPGFWYDQDENEWVTLLKGSAGLRFENQESILVLNPGDYLHIDRHRRHRVEWTDPQQETVWLALHYKNL